MGNRVSIKDASVLTGKSEKTIRRFVKKTLKTSDKNKLEKVQTEGGGYAWYIDKSYLVTHYPTPPDKRGKKQVDTSSGQNETSSGQDGQNVQDPIIRAIDELSAQLKEKDKQINDLMDLSKKNQELVFSLNAQIYQLTSGEKPPTTVPTPETTTPQEQSQKDEKVSTGQKKKGSGQIQQNRHSKKRTPQNTQHKIGEWTDDETKKLQELIRSDKSYKEISKQLNRSISSVRGKAGSLKKQKGFFGRLFG